MFINPQTHRLAVKVSTAVAVDFVGLQDGKRP